MRLYADRLEVRYRGELVARPDRVQGEGLEGINYRHLAHSLVRKPGAFRRYVYREALFPTLTFRRAYDVLVGTLAEVGGSGVRADPASGGHDHGVRGRCRARCAASGR